MTACNKQLLVCLEGHPPSVNHMYARGRRTVYKKPEVARWEMRAIHEIKAAANRLWGSSDMSAYAGYPLRVEMIVLRETWHGKTRAKRGLYVRPDLTNFIKAAEDALCRALGLDDCAVIQFVATKATHKYDQTHLKLTILEKT